MAIQKHLLTVEKGFKSVLMGILLQLVKETWKKN